jgi:hypothetical protein
MIQIKVLEPLCYRLSSPLRRMTDMATRQACRKVNMMAIRVGPMNRLGVAQASEIVPVAGAPVAGAQLVGPLPGELASMTVFTGGIGAESKSPEATKTLIKFLTGPEAVSRLKTKGFEPG